MDRKKINEEISEIRSLMNLNEELPYMSPVGPNPGIGLWQGIKNFFNPEDAEEESVFHRQTFVETGKDGRPLGYFVPNMMVGKCYEYSKINLNDPVWKIMGLDILGFVPGEDLFEDEDGAYIKPSPDSPVRIYLPKKTWFNQFSDSIFTIKEVKECDKPKQYEIYRLLFQLKDPNAAIKSLQITKDGIVPVGSIDTDNRGWDVYSTFKSSGYFNVINKGNIQESINTNKIINEQETAYTRYLDKYYGSQEYIDNSAEDAAKKEANRIENEKKEKIMKLMNSNPINSLEEYSWSNIEQKAGRSDFDVWYDSSSGTIISIGVALLLGVLTGGLSVAITAGIESAILATTARVAIVIGTEAIIGVPEAIYLYERGMESQAGLIIFMCLIPAFGELGRFNRFIKKPASFDDAVETLTRKYQVGEMKSPAQFKQWLDGIKATDKVLYDYITKMLPLAEQTAKNGTKTLERQIYSGLDKAFKSYNQLDFAKATRYFNNVQKKLLNEVPKAWPSTLKMLGFTLGSAAVAGIIFVVFFSSDSELGKPSELKSRIDKGITVAQTKLGVKIFEPLKKQIDILSSQITAASLNNDWDLFYKKTNELLLIYKDLCRIGAEDSIVPTKLLSVTIFDSYQKSLLKYAIDVQKVQSGVIKSIDVVQDVDDAKVRLLNSRSDLPNADSTFFIDTKKVCEFLNWCYKNYNTNYSWYYNLDLENKKGEVKKNKIKIPGIYGGNKTPNESISNTNTICNAYFNPSVTGAIQYNLNEFLQHPLMKSLWSDYGSIYKGLSKKGCDQPGFVQITKASEIGAKDETKYEYCSFVDDTGKTLYFRKPK